jgi:hypothetical protein
MKMMMKRIEILWVDKMCCTIEPRDHYFFQACPMTVYVT